MITVLHLSHIINQGDFIDVVIRQADRTRFKMLAAVFGTAGSIKPGNDDYPVTDLKVQSRADFPVALLRLRQILRMHGVDVLHTHHFDPTLLGTVATVFGHAPRLIIGRHYSDALYQLAPKWKCRAYLAIESMCNRAASCIVAPSLMVHALLVDRQGVSAGKVAQIPYGFNFEKNYVSEPGVQAHLRRELGLDGRLVIGSFSRLNSDKGHIYLLQAFGRLAPRWPNLRLLLVGDGNARAQLEQEVAIRGLEDRVVFAGWRQDVVDLMAMAEVVVQPTLHEAFSQVMVEAMAIGKPLVMTDVSGVRDVVRHRWNGLIVPTRDAVALESAIMEFLSNPNTARTMGQRGLELVRRELDIRRVIARYESVYEQVLGSQNAQASRAALAR